MGGKWSKEAKIINSLRSKQRKDSPHFGNFELPNKSGDHHRSYKRDTPTQNIDLVNKKYVDDEIAAAGGVDWTADQSPSVIHANNYVDNDTTYVSSDFTHDDLVSGTIADHDTTATGAELNSLTDNSVANTLHRHSELVASDGSPDPVVSSDAAGIIELAHQSGFKAYMGSDQDITQNTVTTVQFDTEEDDIQSEFNTGTYTFTASNAGKYQVSVSIYYLENLVDGKVADVRVLKNGALYAYYSFQAPGVMNPALGLSLRMPLAANDYISIQVNHTHTEARKLYGIYSHFSAGKIA